MAELLDKFTGELPLKEAYDDLLHPAAAEIGQTLALPFRIVNRLLRPVSQWVTRGEENLVEISRMISEEVKDVPPDQLTDPELYVAIPALQAITYSMDCDELKKMYAKLLAKAITVGEQDKVHPAYVELIKQMSPLDAHVLRALPKAHGEYFSLCDIRWQEISHQLSDEAPSFRSFKNGYELHSHLLPRYVPGADERDMTISIENLCRLGLVEILASKNLVGFACYKGFEYSSLVNEYRTAEVQFPGDPSTHEFALIRSMGCVTSFGKAFSEICLSDSPR